MITIAYQKTSCVDESGEIIGENEFEAIVASIGVRSALWMSED